MIQRVYTPRASVVLSTSTMQFKLVAIMLIVQYYKKISIPKLQVCLWGVQLDENFQMILKLETKKDKVNVVLDVNANNFISEISNIEIGQEINDALQQMGKLSDTLLKNIEFDF